MQTTNFPMSAVSCRRGRTDSVELGFSESNSMLQALTKHAVKRAVRGIQPRTPFTHHQSHASQADQGGTCCSNNIVAHLFVCSSVHLGPKVALWVQA